MSSQQCAKLREKIGFTAAEDARRAGVSLELFRAALAGVDWRKTKAIPLVTVQTVIKRLKSHPGYPIEAAARALGTTAAWVDGRISDGTVKLLCRTWSNEHLYLSEPMMKRLREAFTKLPPATTAPADGLRLSEAAFEAGVTATTIIKWANDGKLMRIKTPIGWKYPREQVRTRARQYWKTVRFHRAAPPEWLASESSG